MSEFVTCQICKREYKQLTKGHLRSHGLNVQEYRETYGPTYSETTKNLRKKTCYGLKKGKRYDIPEESKEKLRKSIRDNILSKGLVAESNKRRTGWRMTPEQRANVSRGRRLKADTTPTHGHPKFWNGIVSTKFGDFRCLSSYEKDFLYKCEKDPGILSVVTPPWIFYYYKEHIHKYYPDFLVSTSSGSYCVEVKPHGLIDTPLHRAKMVAADIEFDKLGIKYVFITEEDIYGKSNISSQL